MKNFVHDGKMLQLLAPAGGVVAGTPILIGNTLVVPSTTAAEGVAFAAAPAGVFDLPKKANDTFAQGAICYWNVANGYFTSTAALNYNAGTAEVAAVAADATVRVKLANVPLVANGA